MRLKRLEIQGFKSFARPVRLEFGEGITAIVGPNGSGKSNISDAVRWVLGEQSARSLRGQRMEDVIFAGSDGKRPLGMAEVQLTLDNTQGFLPVDYSEVSVTRRVYRSGDSEFLINKQNCRLRDIHDLFTDTGLGREGYAIIGQGQIEAVLSVRSEDRRVLLEETAGIIKYRQRKEEALRKLEDTSVDLLRVSDILHELEGQLDPLKEQAEQARSYLKLVDQLRKTELDYYGLGWRKIKSKLKECEEKQVRIQKDLKVWTERSNELEEKKVELETRVQVLEGKIEQEQKELFASIEAYNQGQHTIELYKERLKNHQIRSEQLEKVQRQKERELNELKEQREAIQVELSQLITEIKAQERVIEKTKANLEQLGLEQRNKQAIIDQLKDDFFDFVRKLADQRNLQRGFHDREQGLKAQITAVDEELTVMAEAIEDFRRQRENLGKQGDKLQKTLEKIRSKQELKQAKLARLKVSITEIQGKKRSLEGQSTQITARLKTLQELEEGYEGYALGVRRIMQNSQTSQLVLGTVAEVIKVPTGLEVAYEVALGSALQNVITANEGHAKRLIAWLQEVRGGRVTFLPLNTVKASYLAKQDQDKLARPGVLGTGLELLEFSKTYEPVLASLLGRVIITEDLDCALDLKRDLRYFARIVTREGSVVFPSGAMTGGSLNNRTSGLLARKAELDTLKEELCKLEGELETQGQLESNTLSELAQLEKGLADLEKERIDTQLKLQSNQQSMVQIIQESQNGKASFKRLEERKAELKVVLQELKGEFEVAVAQVGELEAEEGERRREISLQETNLAELSNSLEQVGERLTSEQILLTELKGTLENLRYRIANLDQREKNTKEVFQEAKSEQDRLTQEKQGFANSIQATEEANKIHKIMEQDLELSLDLQRKERKETQAQVLTINIELDKVQKEQVQRERSLYRGEVELDQLEREQGEILSALEERELTLADALAEEVEKSEGVLKRAIESFRKQIRDLGLVNPGAAEEYERVLERCEFLRTQLEDLNNARDSLQDVINEMDKLCRTKLWDTFKRVQKEFQEIFSQLFGGGKASLELTDPDSILTTGIEIMACPPGKKLQNLLLLSGGERALTAIALLFAIRKVKPTPFCILDEIDAALDESNLGRFTRLMKEFAQDTQFLVITHRPKTMEAANTLYGVTMGEEAVSQIISVALT